MQLFAEEVREPEAPDYDDPRYGRNTFPLERRLTHKYVGTWKHLDEWDDVGYAVIRCSEVELTDDTDPCEPCETTMVVEVWTRQPEPQAVIREAIISSLTSHGCSHEYDCCGCRSTWVGDVAHAINGKWLVSTYSSRNY